MEIANPLGPWGGPSLRYRGAELKCRPDGRVCAVFLEGHPFDALAIDYAVDEVATLIDYWLDTGELPG